MFDLLYESTNQKINEAPEGCGTIHVELSIYVVKLDFDLIVGTPQQWFQKEQKM